LIVTRADAIDAAMFREMARLGLARARERGAVHWLSLRCETPLPELLALFAADETSGQAGSESFFWSQPERNLTLIGFGSAHTITAAGSERFETAGTQTRALFDAHDLFDFDAAGGVRRVDAADDVHDVGDVDNFGPLMLGGFAFYADEMNASSDWSDFGSGQLVLPTCLFLRDGEREGFVVSLGIEPDEAEGEISEGIARRVDEARRRLADASSATLERPASAIASLMDLAGDTSPDHEEGPEYRVRADRPHAHYCGQVESALADIEAGKLSKVVLARSLRVMHDRSFALAPFVRTLTQLYPSCVVVAVRRSARSFIAATPERLVGLSGDRVETGAVAGSAPRGRSPDEEARFSRALLESAKERAEHDVVKRVIRSALREVCGDLAGPAEPRLLRLEGIQHLETPLVGRLLESERESIGLLELVGRLHPTPAVAGAPRATSVDWLQRFEGLDRGWYAGPVGYVDARGQGEFRVALRSGLICEGEARLFAGAGIVAGSEPAAELAETRLKLRALLAPLTEI
jgi:isochorismate synthase